MFNLILDIYIILSTSWYLYVVTCNQRSDHLKVKSLKSISFYRPTNLILVVAFSHSVAGQITWTVDTSPALCILFKWIIS